MYLHELVGKRSRAPMVQIRLMRDQNPRPQLQISEARFGLKQSLVSVGAHRIEVRGSTRGSDPMSPSSKLAHSVPFRRPSAAEAARLCADEAASDEPWSGRFARMHEELQQKGYTVVRHIAPESVTKAAAQAVRNRANKAFKLLGLGPGPHFEHLLHVDWSRTPPNWPWAPWNTVKQRGWSKGPGIGRSSVFSDLTMSQRFASCDPPLTPRSLALALPPPCPIRQQIQACRRQK
jgi:hypothetical protein